MELRAPTCNCYEAHLVITTPIISLAFYQHTLFGGIPRPCDRDLLVPGEGGVKNKGSTSSSVNTTYDPVFKPALDY